MLLKGIFAISAAVSVLMRLTGIVPSNVWLPAAFAGCFVLLLGLWALSCIICTRFVRLDVPCLKRSRIFRLYANCIIDSLTQLLRIKIHVTGREKLPEEKFLLVCNHRSALDPILEMGVFRNFYMGFVAKQELFKIPVIGRLMHECFCFSLDRENIRDGLKVMQQAADWIQSQTASVGIYPEGTRSRDGRLLPFKNGAFKIAKKAQCPIVVVIIRNTEKIMGHAPFKRTDVYMDIVDTIDAKTVSGMKTAQLSMAISNKMKAALAAYSN